MGHKNPDKQKRNLLAHIAGKSFFVLNSAFFVLTECLHVVAEIPQVAPGIIASGQHIKWHNDI